MNTTERKAIKRDLTYAVTYRVEYYDAIGRELEVYEYHGTIQLVMQRVYLVLTDRSKGEHVAEVPGAVLALIRFYDDKVLKMAVEV